MTQKWACLSFGTLFASSMARSYRTLKKPATGVAPSWTLLMQSHARKVTLSHGGMGGKIGVDCALSVGPGKK